MAGHKSAQQQIEHLLFGSVSEEELKPLLDRLRGLCDYATSGGVTFTDREIAYKIGTIKFAQLSRGKEIGRSLHKFLILTPQRLGVLSPR